MSWVLIGIFDGVISVLSVNYHPSGRVVSVPRVNYIPPSNSKNEGKVGKIQSDVGGG